MSKIILYTNEPQLKQWWIQISRIILGPTMLCQKGSNAIVVFKQEETIAKYDGDWSYSDLMSFCLNIAAQDLQQAQPCFSFSQYAGSL